MERSVSRSRSAAYVRRGACSLLSAVVLTLAGAGLAQAGEQSAPSSPQTAVQPLGDLFSTADGVLHAAVDTATAMLPQEFHDWA